MVPPQVRLLLAQAPPGPVVFDADGTLWRGDVGEDFLRFALHEGLFAGSYATYDRLLAESAPRAYAHAVEIMAGVNALELAQWCQAFFEKRIHGRIFNYVRPTLRALVGAGFEPWICSASPWWAVVPGALALGIPEARVIGVTCPVVEGRLTGVVDRPVPVGPGKVTWLQKRGVRPALAVGNGEFDLDMLVYADRALVVAPPDSHNGLVHEASLRTWPVLRA